MKWHGADIDTELLRKQITLLDALARHKSVRVVEDILDLNADLIPGIINLLEWVLDDVEHDDWNGDAYHCNNCSSEMQNDELLFTRAGDKRCPDCASPDVRCLE